MRMGWGATKTLVYDDMLAIMRECPSVVAAAPGSQAAAQVVFGNDNWATNINGTEPQYFRHPQLALCRGHVLHAR